MSLCLSYYNTIHQKCLGYTWPIDIHKIRLLVSSVDKTIHIVTTHQKCIGYTRPIDMHKIWLLVSSMDETIHMI